MPTWPADLPAVLLIRGYEETAPDVIKRTPMDAGPAKVRRRFSANVRPVKGTMVLSGTQKASLDTFFETTIAGGALAFDWQAKSWRFVEPPAFSPIALNLWEVRLSLEVLP